jgi:flagellar motility protein MotE (MotC chaperone)
MARPSLLLMTAAVSALAAAANGVSAASPQDGPATTRLGTSIQSDLNAHDSAAARRKRALDMREQAAAAAEARLQAQAEAGRKAAAAGPAAATPEAQFDELARIYQAMKPARAAPVFEQLTMEVQLKIAQRMRERSTAMLLAAMTPKGAAALSMALARGTASPPARPRPRP